MSKPSLAERLRLLRLRAGLEPFQLADRAGVARSTVSKIESGAQKSMSMDTASKLAKALKCDPAELLGDVPLSVPVHEPASVIAASNLEDDFVVAEMPKLIAEYLTSPWCAADNPTPAELRWLASWPGFLFPRGAEQPGAGTIHRLLMLHREGRI